VRYTPFIGRSQQRGIAGRQWPGPVIADRPRRAPYLALEFDRHSRMVLLDQSVSGSGPWPLDILFVQSTCTSSPPILLDGSASRAAAAES